MGILRFGVAFERQRQEDQKFKVSLGYIEVILDYMRPCHKQSNKCISTPLFTLLSVQEASRPR